MFKKVDNYFSSGKIGLYLIEESEFRVIE